MDDDQSTGRTLEIALPNEVVSIPLDDDTFEHELDEYISLLREATSPARTWNKLAAEYWRRDNLDAAQKVCNTGVEVLTENGLQATLAPIYAMLASLQIAYAGRAPKMILSDPQADVLSGKTKNDYIGEATVLLNRTITMDVDETLLYLTRGMLQLSSRQYEDAFRAFDNLLARHPNNVVALIGRGRVLYQRRQYTSALRTFQRVLQISPNSLPDPRVGIGMCLWSLGARDKARAAWARSLEVHPGHYPSLTLLGLASINASKDVRLPDAERAQEYSAGIKLVEQAFKVRKGGSAAANALAEMFLRKGPSGISTAIKLAERTVQHADTISLLHDGHLRAARALHSQGKLAEATRHYEAAANALANTPLVALGMAGVQITRGQHAAAAHILERVLTSVPQPPSEVPIILASLHAFARPGISSTELAKGRTRARELYDRALREIDVAGRALAKSSGLVGDDARVRVRALGEEVALHVELARLWAEDPARPVHAADRALKALSEALRVAKAAGATSDSLYARLLNNVGALKHGAGVLEEARSMYEDALAVASALQPEDGEGISVSVLYNLGRCLEDMGERGISAGAGASEVYSKILGRHSEYVDAKVRQAHLLASQSRMGEAHELLKQALASAPHALNLRAYYTNFLLRVGQWKPARDFAFATLRDCDKNDVYALCAAGIVLYQQAREAGRGFGGANDPPMNSDERRKNFIRACEFFDKALAHDSACAVAAQGLAIALAEDALGTLGGALGAPAAGLDAARAAREALDVFTKVRETLVDGAVYTNMGHCYYARDEFERAIESYETANKRFYEGRNVAVLLCLSRTWYAKANKDQSFTSMNNALKFAQQAMHMTPGDKAIIYNIAMIEQKAAEMLFGLEPSRRTLKELTRAIAQAEHAQTLFASLAADKSQMLPYSRDIADQRRRYGDTMLRKRAEQVTRQEEYEREVNAKYDAARQRRQEEKERVEAAERLRQEQLRKQAEVLAEERRKARAELEELTSRLHDESEEERERKAAKKRAREQAAAAIVEDGADGSTQKKRKRTTKKRTRRGREGDGDDDEGVRLPSEDEDEAMFSAPEDRGEDVQAKRVPKKRVIKDDEEDEPDATAHKRKKIKSKEVISDSDMED